MHKGQPRESFVRFLIGAAIIAVLWTASTAIDYPSPWLTPAAWLVLIVVSFYWLNKFSDTVGLLLDILSIVLIVGGTIAFATKAWGEDWRTYGIIAFVSGCGLGLVRMNIRRKAAAPRTALGTVGSARSPDTPAGKSRSASRDCPQCGGRGQTACDSCHGRGVLTCPTCGGNGMFGFNSCPRCGGATTVTCDDCSGVAYLPCVLCHGSGKVN